MKSIRDSCDICKNKNTHFCKECLFNFNRAFGNGTGYYYERKLTCYDCVNLRFCIEAQSRFEYEICDDFIE